MTAKCISLFTNQEGFEACAQAYIQAQKNKKRVHYKQTTYTKYYKNDKTNGIDNKDSQLWEKMNYLYTVLGNFFPLSFLELRSQEDTQYDFGIITLWRNIYTDEEYEYKGATGWKTYTGQNFIVMQAEIKGSQDLGIQERIFLHQSFIELLENGANPNMLNWGYEMMVNFLMKHTIKDLLIYLKNKHLPMLKDEHKEIIIKTLEEVINGSN